MQRPAPSVQSGRLFRNCVLVLRLLAEFALWNWTLHCWAHLLLPSWYSSICRSSWIWIINRIVLAQTCNMIRISIWCTGNASFPSDLSIAAIISLFVLLQLFANNLIYPLYDVYDTWNSSVEFLTVENTCFGDEPNCLFISIGTKPVPCNECCAVPISSQNHCKEMACFLHPVQQYNKHRGDQIKIGST